MPKDNKERMIRKLIQIADEGLRAAAHYQGIASHNFRDEPAAAQTQQTLKNALLELFVIKFHILFSESKNDKHRIGAFEGLEAAFMARLGDEKAIEEFEAYKTNVRIARSSAVAHVDTPAKFERLTAEGLHWPRLDEGVGYLCLLWDTLSGRDDASQNYEKMAETILEVWTND